MTLFDCEHFSEIKDAGWSFNTLRPPLKLKEILLDFKFQWLSYCNNKLSYHQRILFLILRVFQRFSYNIGWIISSRKFKKAQIRKGGK